MAESSRFTLYPAIDIRGGNCVRLFKGDYQQETVYGDPLEMAEVWQEQGASTIHVVDLDGAKAGEPIHFSLIQQIAERVHVPIQVGGGIRRLEHVRAYLEHGVERVILGTSAIKNPTFVRQALSDYGERIVIGLDAANGYVAAEGWTETSAIKVEELAEKLVEYGAKTFIFTDIRKDGTLSGPNVEATVKLARACGKEVIASGGISRLQDLQHLVKHLDDGITGAIIGKALYQSVFTLREALKTVEVR